MPLQNLSPKKPAPQIKQEIKNPNYTNTTNKQTFPKIKNENININNNNNNNKMMKRDTLQDNFNHTNNVNRQNQNKNNTRVCCIGCGNILYDWENNFDNISAMPKEFNCNFRSQFTSFLILENQFQKKNLKEQLIKQKNLINFQI